MTPAFIEAVLDNRREEASFELSIELPDEFPRPGERRFLEYRLRQMREDARVEIWCPSVVALDGRMIGETAATAPLLMAGDLFIGHRPSGEMPLSYRGAIDEVAIYDRALEGRELARHHRAGPSGITTSRFALFRWLDP